VQSHGGRGAAAFVLDISTFPDDDPTFCSMYDLILHDTASVVLVGYI
jgi:hypothetical protein